MEDQFLFVSSFEPKNDSCEKCELDVFLEKPVFAPGDEVIATVRLNVLATMVNIRAISWQFFGAEMLQRSGGYLSRNVVANQTEYLVGSEETVESKSGPDIADKTHILEADPYFWDVRFTIPEKIPPTFRTDTARIEYYFSVTITRKLEEKIEHKILVPVATDFSQDCDPETIIEETSSDIIPATGIFSRFFAAPENKITISCDANQFQHCPFGMERPCISAHMSIVSTCTDTIQELNCLLTRKTILHHKDQDVNETVLVCESILPLIPPLVPNTTQEYYVQIPVNARGRFVNPSRFSARCVFNEYFIEIGVKGVTTRFCVCISTYNPNPHPLVIPLAISNEVQTVDVKAEPEKQKRSCTRQEITKWDVNSVLQWLQQNNLSKFADAFKEQEVDGQALLNLEEKYFPSLGITLIGDKIKLESALKSLR